MRGSLAAHHGHVAGQVARHVAGKMARQVVRQAANGMNRIGQSSADRPFAIRIFLSLLLLCCALAATAAQAQRDVYKRQGLGI